MPAKPGRRPVHDAMAYASRRDDLPIWSWRPATAFRGSARPVTRLRRAVLVVPATSWPKLEKAAGLDVDEVVIDLEDAVPVSLKTDKTRRQAVDAIARLAWRAPTLAVRVNAFGTPWFEDDIAEIVEHCGQRLACIVLPKVELAEAVMAAVGTIDAARAGARIGVEALIESALGVVFVESIAAATPRLETLISEPETRGLDGPPMAGIGAIEPAYPGDQWAYPRARIALAAHAFGLEAIDGPFGAFRDSMAWPSRLGAPGRSASAGNGPSTLTRSGRAWSRSARLRKSRRQPNRRWPTLTPPAGRAMASRSAAARWSMRRAGAGGRTLERARRAAD